MPVLPNTMATCEIKIDFSFQYRTETPATQCRKFLRVLSEVCGPKPSHAHASESMAHLICDIRVSLVVLRPQLIVIRLIRAIRGQNHGGQNKRER